MSDLHVGEGCAGTAFNLGQTSVPPCFSAPDYADLAAHRSMPTFVFLAALAPHAQAARATAS